MYTSTPNGRMIMRANQIIREILVRENTTLTQLAQMLGVSISSLSNKLNRPSMKYNDVQQILHMLGYELVAHKKDEPSNEDTLLQMISSKVISELKNEIADDMWLSLDDAGKKK